MKIPPIDYHYLGDAFTYGIIYHLGEYPGLKPDLRSNRKVYGELYSVKTPHEWEALDTFENAAPTVHTNPEYERKIIKVHCKNDLFDAYAYVYLKPVHHNQLITSGKF